MKRFIALKWPIFIFAAFLYFFVSPDSALAADAGEFVFFRIDTEINVLNAKGVTVEWSCNGTASGSITETAGGIASESTQLIDGIVKVASASKEMTDATCIFNTSDTIKAKVSLGGWLTRRWSVLLPASTSSPFSTLASMDYTIRVNGVADELNTALTLNGTTASATYSGTVASQSYSNYGGTWRKYIAGSTAGGTVTGGADGYVNRATTNTLTISATASTSVDFGVTATTSLNDESGLLFGHKIQVYEVRTTFDTGKITSGTVTAGDSYGTTCTAGTGSNAGYWYCPVPLANTETSAKFSGNSSYQTATTNYVDRSVGSDNQNSAVIAPHPAYSSGGGGGLDPTPTPTPTPSPAPTPSSTPTPTPTTTLTPVTVVKLFRKANDPKVYVETNGTLTWIRTLEEFNAAGYQWKDVQVISGKEFAQLRIGGKLRVVRGIGYLRIRDLPSLRGKVVGRTLPNEEWDFDKKDGDWYKIKKDGKDVGWVFGKYVSEI